MFGSTASSGSSLFGGLNNSKPTFSGGLFGNTTSGTGSLFSSQNTTATKGGLFGSTSTGGTGLFGSNPTSSSGLFGGTSGSFFGKPTTTGFPSLNSNSGGLFGTGTSSSGSSNLFGLPSKPAENNENLNQLMIHAAVSNPQLFPDERNSVIAGLNQLQASWGFGKAFYSANGQPADISPENPFCRFKTVAYCSLPSRRDEDGEVCLVINKPAIDLVSNQQALIDTLFSKVFSSNQTVSITVTSTKPISDSQSEVVFYVEERLPPTGHKKRIAASKLYQFLTQPTQSRELNTNLGVQSLRPNKTISQNDLDIYLANPPAGLDKFLWQQAIANNPDPERLLPVPILGFKQLHQRLKQQQQMNSQHKSRVESMNNDLKDLRKRQAVSQAKLEQHKTKAMQLGHRLLLCIGCIERARKLGYPLQEEESNLYRQLHIIHQQLSQPTKLKSHLAELLSQARLGGGSLLGERERESSSRNYSVSAEHKQQLALFLKQQQEGIANLVQMMKTTAEELKLMQNQLAS